MSGNTHKDGVAVGGSPREPTRPADRLLDGVLARAGDVITVTDRASGRFLEVSDSFCTLSGYTREELIGRTAGEVCLIGDESEWDAGAGIGSAPGDTSKVQLRSRDGTRHSLELSRALMQGDRVVLTVGREASERARRSSGLAAREVRFRAAAESTLECVAIILPIRDATGAIVDFRFEYVNDAYCRLVRFKREQLLGRRLGEVFPGFTSSDRFELCCEVVRTGESRHDEDVASAEIANSPIAHGTVLDVNIASMGDELLISARDVSERHRLEAQLHASEQRFHAAIGAMPDAVMLLSPVVDDRSEIVDFRYEYVNDAYCRLVHADADQLLGRPITELHPAFSGSARFALFRHVAITGEPAADGELIDDEAWAGSPLAGRVLDTVIAPTEDSIIVSARDVTDRYNAERAHHAAEARFRDVIESAPDAMVLVDREGTITLVNAQTERLFGYQRAELIGQDHELLVPESARARHRGHRDRYFGDAQARPMGAGLELSARRKDGTEFPVEVSLSPLTSAEGPVVCSSIRDVTARRRAEQELALRAELLDLAHDAVIVREPSENRVTFWNREAQALYGYSAAEAAGLPTHELLMTVFPESKESLYEVLARDGQWRGELRHVCKDGSEILVSSRQALQRDASGRAVAIIELNSDITAQRQAETELRGSRERLAEAERVGGLGSWEGDLTTGRIAYSDGMLALYGLSAHQFDGTAAAARAFTYPDDRDHFDTVFRRALEERSSFQIEYRVIRGDGRVRSLRCQGDVIVDDTGQPVRAIGIVQDITDAMLTQEALRKTSAELGRRASELQQLALRTAADPADIPQAPLTARQLEILKLIAQGFTNAAIADRLVLTEGTIKWHVRQILTKTNTRNRAEAIARVLGTPG